ncbi:sodium:solute symporter family protein [Aquicella lusitana]|uniref:Na+/proline symporter n=1 Tax=Aquicella lusitana TaxID=254246 RepID=A0A370GE47_9COXI|nr:sodium:solute symporter [Aquicella lusitana]RDI42072.1 Na+/proline symporter [Aquicella lusitana]VVC74421.1 hypothetical protein AQULUS_21870 [Aquicella lusitana]
MTAWNIILFFFFLSLMIIAGQIRSAQVKSESQYLLANRKTRLFALIATLVMTELNTSTLLAFSGMGYLTSWWALSLPLVFLIGLIFYALTVAKPWKEFNGISVADYFTARYGRDIGYLVSFILFSAMAGFSATYIKSLTLIFMPLFPMLNAWLLSGVLVILVLLMTLRGGLVAIIRTDVISFILICFFLPVLLYCVWRMPKASTPPLLSLQQMQELLPPQFVVSLILLTMFSYILAPWYGQKIIAARNANTAYLAVLCAAILIFLFYGLGIGITSLLRTKGIMLSQAELALPYSIHQAFPISLQGLAYGILFCIAATTLAGVWSAMVTLLVGAQPAKEKQIKLNRSMQLTILCAVVSYGGANLFVDHILNKMILANIPIVALSFALLAGFYWKKTSRTGVYLSILSGIFWGAACYYHYGETGNYTWYWSVYGIPLIFITGITGSLFYPGQTQERFIQT